MPDAISLLVAASEGRCPQDNSPESGFDSIKVVKQKNVFVCEDLWLIGTTH
jgi:hypothetical protein